MDIEREVREISQAEPFIVVTGRPGTEVAQFFICEKSILLESKSLRDAFIDIIAAYYVFGIAYPKSVAGMIFFQHYVFNMKDQQPPPSCLCKLVQNFYTMD